VEKTQEGKKDRRYGEAQCKRGKSCRCIFINFSCYIAKVLSGIDFPKSKDEIKEYAKYNISKARIADTEAVLGLLDELSSKEYSNMADVELEIGRIK
jgi:Protein of unknown function (DUF2795)